jgi:Malate synthase
MGDSFIKINTLSVSKNLIDFVKNELLTGLDVNEKDFWDGFDKSINELAPINKKLLEVRETLQSEIDLWLKKNRNGEFNHQEYKNFLKEIGYLKEEGNDFKIDTKKLDSEISSIAGPQLVVPIMNSRYTLNAANARWVSLYDSLYGTDLIESEETGSQKYDPLRGQEVIRYAREFLNDHFSINEIHWKDINGFKIKGSDLKILKDDKEFELVDKNKFIGYRGEPNNPTTIILENNNLKIEIIINPKSI